MPRDVGPEVLTMMSRLIVGRYSSMSFFPNSRFMNELAVIMPTNAALRAELKEALSKRGGE